MSIFFLLLFSFCQFSPFLCDWFQHILRSSIVSTVDFREILSSIRSWAPFLIVEYYPDFSFCQKASILNCYEKMQIHSTLIQLVLWKDGEGFILVKKKKTTKTIQCSWCITEGNFHRGFTVAEQDHHIFQFVGSSKICYIQLSSRNMNTLKTWASGMHLIIHDTTLSWTLIS